jgi:hypothetical protein
MATDAGRRDSWQRSFLMACIVGFLALAMLPSALSLTILKTKLPWFWALALLPGIIGIANHLVVSRQYKADEEEDESQHRPTFGQMFATASLLTGVFCIVARATGDLGSGLDGLVYAGYGTYISTVWFMLVRLNANALSPRFMANSALKASIALMIGYVASTTDIVKQFGKIGVSLPAMYFLVGLFHSWAMKALRKTAMATFGVTQTGAADLPVRLLEGVDDGAVDVLEELGITSIQHLATMHAPEVCGRSLYPRDRVLDWIDQSILIMHTNGRINDLRTLGIRSAYGLITIANHAREECAGGKTPAEDAAFERFKQVAQRLGTSVDGLYLVKQCIETDPAYISLEETYPDRHKPAAAASAPWPSIVPRSANAIAPPMAIADAGSANPPRSTPTPTT